MWLRIKCASIYPLCFAFEAFQVKFETERLPSAIEANELLVAVCSCGLSVPLTVHTGKLFC